MTRPLGRDSIDRVGRGLARAQADELGTYRLTKAEFDDGGAARG